jgi:hypothetical protein
MREATCKKNKNGFQYIFDNRRSQHAKSSPRKSKAIVADKLKANRSCRHTILICADLVILLFDVNSRTQVK